MKVGSPGTATTLSAPGYTVGDTSITVGSTSNWPTDTGVAFAIDQAQVVNGVEVQVPGTYNEYVGTVASGTSVSNVSWATGSGDRNYSAGALTRVYIPVSATRENRIVDWGLAHANQDGTLKTTAVQAALNTNQVGSTDWTILATTPTLQSSNGQREYDLKYTGVDYTDRLQAGMKLKIPRTVAPQTLSTSLNGTNQYWNKTSPAGMTFTNNFVVGAWVKLSSYAATNMDIVSRYNGTSGWVLRVSSTGQVQLVGLNAGASNYMEFKSYQSLPLNKWVHVSAQMDMTVTTNTPTTNYITLDGVDVPLTVTRNGTSPTALVQAGNLEIGSANGGTEFFPGKIQDIFVTSVKLTQAQVRAFKDQKLTTAIATTYSMVAAYPFDGNGNDVSSNANNLTANNGATATDTDTAFSTDVFAIATAVTKTGSDTFVTAFCPQGAGIPNETLGTTSYSSARAPYGFPSKEGAFDVQMFLGTGVVQASAALSTWYTPSNLSVICPVGVWLPFATITGSLVGSTTAAKNITVGLSTTTASAPIPGVSAYKYIEGQTVIADTLTIQPHNPIVATTTTSIYPVFKVEGSGAITNLGFFSANASTITMRNAYL